MNSKTLSTSSETTEIPGTSSIHPKPGTWYWVKDTDYHGNALEWLGCVVKVGSNFLELHGLTSKNGYKTFRCHFDDFWEELRFEPNHTAVIQDKSAFYTSEIQRLMAEVQAVSSKLGIDPRVLLESSIDDTTNSALVVLSGQSNFHEYKNELIKAKEETLPELFKQIEKTTEILCMWLSATATELKAMVEPLKKSIDEVNSRIFNVSLYAGLTEEAVTILDGQPAEMTTRLHVMQRRLYMDEECLANYTAGGMSFDDIAQFDAWLSKPDNFKRILPFSRTLAAFRVRNETKERISDGSLISDYINFNLKQLDKLTFFYIRNGEQLYRINCDLEFPEFIFPDQSIYEPGQHKMVKMHGSRIDKLISKNEYDQLVQEYLMNKQKFEDWVKVNPGVHRFQCPYYTSDSDPRKEYKSFDPSNVYFDECLQSENKKIEEYNRIAIIIQGLYDRSKTLHPHPPIRTWEPDGFNLAIKLVYDGATTLYAGEKPDFRLYQKKCNSKITKGSFVTGQQHYWKKQILEQLRSKAERDHRDYLPTHLPFSYYGPSNVEEVVTIKPRRKAVVFNWQRESSDWRSNRIIHYKIVVPEDYLLNVSAYTPGDFKQFFTDPRTRSEYLKWAPYMLEAENWHAAKHKEESNS